MIAGIALAASALAGPPATAPARPRVSLVASPARVMLAGTAQARIRVTNSGTTSLVVDVTRAGFALDLRGQPRIVPVRGGPASPARWLAVRPRRLVLAPRGSATLTVAARPPRGAEPGDHGTLVVLTTRPRPGAGLAVRMRLGIVVAVRIGGRIVHRLRPLSLRVRPAGRTRRLELVLANRGNVTETIVPGCGAVVLRRGGRTLAALQPLARQLLPRTRGVVEFVYRGRVRGRVIARVELPSRGLCRPSPARSFAVRL